MQSDSKGVWGEEAEDSTKQDDGGWRSTLRTAENLVITVVLLAMMLVPIINSLLRKFFDTGITGASVITQSLVLVVGMLGGAAAARDNRLLSLSTLRTVLTGRWKAAARFQRSVRERVLPFYPCTPSSISGPTDPLPGC